MTTLTEQQPRGEDGRFAAQPPQDDPARTGQADAARDASADTRTGEKAPAPSTPASDPYEVAAIEVTGKRPEALNSDTLVSEREPTKPDPAAPQPDPHAGPAQSPPPSPSPTTEPTAEQKAGEAAKAYADMSGKTWALLKSVPGGLVTPDEWKDMDSTERTAHVAQVTEFRNEQKRKYNERQQRQPVAPAPLENDPTELRQPPRPQGARDSGVQQQPLPSDASQQLADLAQEFGEDHPVTKAFAAQAQRSARLEQQLAEREQQAQTQAQRAEGERQARLTEDQVFDQLETRYPALNSPRKRDELRQACRDWFNVEYGRNPQVNAIAVIERTVHRELFPETQQRQTTRDQAASSKLRAGSFDRGAPVPPTTKSKVAAGDPYAEVASALGQAHAEGLSGDAAVDRANRLASAQR